MTLLPSLTDVDMTRYPNVPMLAFAYPRVLQEQSEKFRAWFCIFTPLADWCTRSRRGEARPDQLLRDQESARTEIYEKV